MLEKFLKHTPPRLKANKICRHLYWDYIYCINKYKSYRLKKFKDIHKGQRCFIIGNGPSILQQDLTKMKNEITFAVNEFVLHEQYNEINPTYYCVCNPGHFLAGDFTKWYQLLLTKAKNTIKFFPLSFEPWVKKHNIFVGQPVFYLNNVDKPIWETGLISLDITEAVYPSGTVIIDFPLPLAFYMGFSEIYLLGCDCDFKLDKAKHSLEGHFYSPEQELGRPDSPINDIESWYNEWHNNMMKSYLVVKETFERHGRKIYNAGIGGKLEVFERVNYDELF